MVQNHFRYFKGLGLSTKDNGKPLKFQANREGKGHDQICILKRWLRLLCGELTGGGQVLIQ